MRDATVPDAAGLNATESAAPHAGDGPATLAVSSALGSEPLALAVSPVSSMSLGSLGSASSPSSLAGSEPQSSIAAVDAVAVVMSAATACAGPAADGEARPGKRLRPNTSSAAVSLSPEEEEEHERCAMSALVTRARAAQSVITDASQETVDRLCRALVYAVAREGVSEELARLCVSETQLGDFAGKVAKLQRKTRCALFDISSDASCGEIERDSARELLLLAKPVGVIGATTPSTNCEATPVIKAINAVKGRNAIVIAPHPRARRSTWAIVGMMRAALTAVGAPADLVIAVERPSRLSAQLLMRQCDRVWATGGNGMVRHAHLSGTPALGVGQGNACIVVDASADLELAADGIARSKTFDLAASCSADNCVLAADAVHDALEAALERRGGHVLRTPRERELLRRALFDADGQLNAAAVVRAAPEIARLAGIELPSHKTFLIVPEQGVGREHPFSGEKLSVVLALYRVSGPVDAFIELTNRIQAYQGHGHSCGIYSTRRTDVLRFATETLTSRVMVNQPQALSNSGALWNGMRQTLSLGCGSWGRTATTDNVYWRHFVNITYVSWPLPAPKQLPSDEDLFRDLDCDAIARAAPSPGALFCATDQSRPPKPLDTTAPAEP
jgi:sulfoacetaldehyde dehydrogenase